MRVFRLASIVLLFASSVFAGQSFQEYDTGTGSKVGTESRTQGGNTVHDQTVIVRGGTGAFNTSQVTVGNSEVQLTTVTTCNYIMIEAGAGEVYIGTTGVTSSTGMLINSGTWKSFPMSDDCDQLYVIRSTAATKTVYVVTK